MFQCCSAGESGSVSYESALVQPPRVICESSAHCGPAPLPVPRNLHHFIITVTISESLARRSPSILSCDVLIVHRFEINSTRHVYSFSLRPLAIVTERYPPRTFLTRFSRTWDLGGTR
jgi:hypothetical protein